MLLFINACVRKESRTKELADTLLAKQNEPYEELVLKSLRFPLVDEAFLNRRDDLIARRDFSDPVFDLARQFAEADEIVIAAPFWDLSFPAALKQYFEQINVRGITFFYTPEGIPTGLCRARRLTYITTVGGDFLSGGIWSRICPGAGTEFLRHRRIQADQSYRARYRRRRY
jgi:Acyl carrier protein phosphodiesterase